MVGMGRCAPVCPYASPGQQPLAAGTRPGTQEGSKPLAARLIAGLPHIGRYRR